VRRRQIEPIGFGSLSGGPPPADCQLVPPQLWQVGSDELVVSVMLLPQLAQLYPPAGASLPAEKVGIELLSDESLTRSCTPATKGPRRGRRMGVAGIEPATSRV
jgi:hypothetical protein